MVDNVLSSARFSTIVIRFSEPLDPVSAAATALYSLAEAGPNGTPGDGDDVAITVSSVTYTPGDVEVRLNLASQLPQGLYRLTLVSGAVDAIVDQAGNALDGDGNGSPTGNFVRNFRLDLTAPVVGSVVPSGTVGTGPSQFTILFQENLQMNAATVTNPVNYGLVSTLRETFGTADDVNESARITSVTYDPGTTTATVNLSGPLPVRRYQLTIRPSVADQAGNPLGNGVAYVSPLNVGVPILSPIGNKSVFDGALLSFTANATDSDGDLLTFSLAPGAPVGATITTGGLFTWTPTEGQASVSYNVKVIVTDNSVPALTASETIAISVLFNPAPVLLSAVINAGGLQRSRVNGLTLQFSEDVSATLDLNDLTLRNLTTATDITPATMTLTYAPGTNRATVTFPALPGQKLPDGRYTLTVRRAGVTDLLGKQLVADFNLSFHVLTGDANGDAVVNDADLYLVWQNLLKPAGARNLNEDLNGDGLVTVADVDVVKSNYLTTLLPRLVDATVNDGTIQRSRVNGLTLQFSEDVSASLALSDLVLTNLTTGADISTGGMALNYSLATNRATLTFPGLPGQKLPDGRYKLTVFRAGVTNASGNQLIADFSFGFHVLTGDANGDAVVNDADLYLVWHDLLKPPGARSLNEDLNGDGQVTTADIDVIESNYLATMPPPGAVSPLPATLTEGGISGSSVAASATLTTASRSLATLPGKAQAETPAEATAPVAANAVQTVGQDTTPTPTATTSAPAPAKTENATTSADFAGTNPAMHAGDQLLIRTQTSSVRSPLRFAESWLRPTIASLSQLLPDNGGSGDLVDRFIMPSTAADDSSNEDRWQTRLGSKLIKLRPFLSKASSNRQRMKGSL